MTKKPQPPPAAAPDREAADDPAYAPGRWYMFLTPGGFTMIGRYVKPLGLGMHRFARAHHMRNAGNHELPEICAKGIGAATFTVYGWRYYDTCPHGIAPYDGEVPAGWLQEDP